MSDYAREFIRLSKYASYMVPTEVAKIRRFRAGLIMPLYNVLLATVFPTLSRLVDTAKQLETRHQEDQIEREQRKLVKGKTQSKIEKTAMVGRQAEQSTYPVPPTQQHEKKRKSQF